MDVETAWAKYRTKNQISMGSHHSGKQTVSLPKKSPFSKSQKLIESCQRPTQTSWEGEKSVSSPNLYVFENPTFSLSDRVKAGEQTDRICQKVMICDRLLPSEGYEIQHRQHVPAPRVHRGSVTQSESDDRTPLFPTRKHSKIAQFLGNFVCWRREHCPIRKEEISWPVVGSLTVRGPDGELQDALIGLSVDGMLNHIVRTESNLSMGYTKHNPDDGIFRRISEKSNTVDSKRRSAAITGMSTVPLNP